MATFRMVGQREIEVETQACIARIDYAYDPGFVYVVLFDKGLSELFEIRTDDDPWSRRLLEKLVNEGVSEEEAEFLRIVQSFSSPKTQARYFERLALGGLTLESALRGVKRRKETQMRFMAAKYLKEVEKRFRRVCTLGSYWTHLMEVLYGEVGNTRLVLFVEREGVPSLRYVMVIRDSEVNLYAVSWDRLTETTYEIFKYIVDGGGEGGRVPCGGLSEADFELFLNFLKEYEEQGAILLHDKELYDFIKSIAAMNVIVGR
jgi:hypothetical protein